MGEYNTMKTCRLWYLLVAAAMLLFGSEAKAQSPRNDIVTAYFLVRSANNNYSGHRNAALRELEFVGRQLGLDLNARGQNNSPQMQSDAKMSQAFAILQRARDRLDARDRQREAGHLDNAMREINLALKSQR
jgi:hypothetical protein